MVFAQNDVDISKGMVFIPGGIFEMGVNKSDLKELVEMGCKVPHMNEVHAYWWFGDEIPKHQVKVESFYMDRYEVTNEDFTQFIQKTGYKAEGNWQSSNPVFIRITNRNGAVPDYFSVHLGFRYIKSLGK